MKQVMKHKDVGLQIMNHGGGSRESEGQVFDSFDSLVSIEIISNTKRNEINY